jgi:FkbM family methyltransferase
VRPSRALIHKTLRRVGLDLVRTSSRAPERIRLLRELGVDVVVDVGANDGQYAAALRSGGFRGRIVSFEPGSEAFRRLTLALRDDPLWDAQRCALGDARGEMVLHLSANEGQSSSLLEMTSIHADAAPHATIVGSETVPVVRLDDVALAAQRPFLKMDVQGAELLVLRGAQEFVQTVLAVEAEMSLAELYAGQPLIDDVVIELRRLGFVLTHLEPEFADGRTGELLSVNGIFRRR